MELLLTMLLMLLTLAIFKNEDEIEHKKHAHEYVATTDNMWQDRRYVCKICNNVLPAKEIEGEDGPPNPGLDNLLQYSHSTALEDENFE